MGCASCQNQADNSVILGKKYFCKLCNIYKEQINSFENALAIQLKGYLVLTKSIPKFTSLIKKYKILDEEEEIDELKLDKESYEIERNIEIINDYSQCMNYIESNNDVDNEFIIVNKKFLDNMKINSENKDVLITIDNRNKMNSINFSDSQIIIFNSISKGFFKLFTFKESTIKNNNNSNFINSNTMNLNHFTNVSKKSNDSNFTWNRLLNNNVININNAIYIQVHNQNSDLSNKIQEIKDTESIPSSNNQ